MSRMPRRIGTLVRHVTFACVVLASLLPRTTHAQVGRATPTWREAIARYNAPGTTRVDGPYTLDTTARIRR